MIVKKKLLKSCLLVIISFCLLSGCTKKENSQESNLDLFNPKTALKVAENYLEYVKDNNIEEANKLCTEELISKNKEISTGELKVVAYAPDNLIESSGSAYILFNVVRSSQTETKCDLDNYALKVLKIKDEYKIDEIKSMSKRQVFVRDKSLRLIGEDGGRSDLILTLNNLPKDVYLSENKVMLYKEKTPSESFGPVALGYKGQKVAISTLANNKAFLSIAYIEESKEAQGQAVGNSATAGANGSSSLEDLLDKPIARKLISLDILEDTKVKNLIFTKEEGYLVVEYLNNNKLNRLNVYKSDDGSLVKLKLNEMFPEDKYNINLKNFDKSYITIEVTGKDGRGDIDPEVVGEYKATMEDEEIRKTPQNT